MMLEVANPIYDVVFKYLLDDNKIAKLLISGLLKQEIISLELKPQEYSTNLTDKILTVYRVDFKATIRLENGEEKVVLIEIQKAKFTSDIMRFRKYLGEQYADKNNVRDGKNGTQLGLPIISIYFLGYPLEKAKGIPIINISRQYLDHSTNEILNIKEQFVEALTHDSIIVQITELAKKQHRNDLEKALSVFQQGNAQQVNINEDDYPPKFQAIIRRLVKALVSPTVRKTMDIEDEILATFNRKERVIDEQFQKLEKQFHRLEKQEGKIEKQEEQIGKQEGKIEKQEEQIGKQEEKLKKQHQEIKAMQLKTATLLKTANIPINEIAKTTGLSEQEIEKL